LYSDAFTLAPHLDVRILLPPVPAAEPQHAPPQPEAPSPSVTSHYMYRGYSGHISTCAPRAAALTLPPQQ
jgi:hypothetical protein